MTAARFSSYRDAFFAPRRLISDKWDNDFEIYDHVFGHLYGRDITYLEIGVQKGGSLEVARSLFGPNARIIGLIVRGPDAGIEPRPAEAV